jgi:hypothetical protein
MRLVIRRDGQYGTLMIDRSMYQLPKQRPPVRPWAKQELER